MPSQKSKGSGRQKTKVARRDPIALRLELALAALGKKPAQVCKETGIAPNALSQYLSGDRTITWRQALKLKKAYGVTLDWLYAGDPADLPYRLGAELARLSGFEEAVNPPSSSLKANG